MFECLNFHLFTHVITLCLSRWFFEAELIATLFITRLNMCRLDYKQSRAALSPPRLFQLYDQNPRICLQTKPAIQRWARSAPPHCPTLFLPSLRSTSSMRSCTPHNGPLCTCGGNTIIVTLVLFRWKTNVTRWEFWFGFQWCCMNVI